LGSSFSFVAVVIAATGYAGHGPNPNLDVALGGTIAVGILYGFIALIGASSSRIITHRSVIKTTFLLYKTVVSAMSGV
jgi:xanthine/uracil permease